MSDFSSYIKELGLRTLVAVFAIPALCVIFYLGDVYFVVFVSLVLVLALREFYRLVEKDGYGPIQALGMLAILCICWDVYLHTGRGVPIILFVFLFLTLAVELFRKKEHPLVNASVTIFGVAYISLFSFLILIRELPYRVHDDYRMGGWILIYIFSTIWACDSSAYIIGARVGKHPLYRRVSPKKSWEGAVAGLVIGLAAAVALRWVFVPSFSLLDGLIIGTVVGVFGQLSDLVESLFKRESGVKDASRLIPGHGGVLDRFDSSLFVAPLVYFYLILMKYPG